MYLVYEFQLAIFHAKYLMVGLWIVFYTIILWVGDLTSGEMERPIDYYVTLPFNLLFFIYSIFMIKGVREEKPYMLYIVYFGNLFQSLLLFYNTNNYCFQYMNYDPSLHSCFKYEFFFNVIFFLGCLGLITLTLSTWNTIRCHKNFGRNLGFL
ncbi:hypothetical protein GLOIN_2v1501867 [Rhizophagus clarus]|uniref:Uncharacterized protein n=1 Tax=Rhizophagus clarus TaxID=94130 RepID=A0A8H3L4I0_9GLOM|nr:hypothetical protein GLOIN_2v1501867 [Rhizophagus clarus]